MADVEKSQTDKPQFAGEWVRLGDVVEASKERNRGMTCRHVYSVTNSRGFTPSTEYFSKEVFSEDLEAYRVVRRRMIAYNPSRINVGSVALQDELPEVVVSPLYVVFSVDESRLLPEYLLAFLKSRPGLAQISFRSTGTVRNSLRFETLCQLEMKLPCIELQRERVGLLAALSKQTDDLKKLRASLDDIVKSEFVEMFGDATSIASKWNQIPFGECLAVFESGNSPSCSNVPREGDNPAVLKLSALSSGRFTAGENKAMLEGEGINPDKEVKRGDILIARKNTPELVGSCVIVRDEVKNLMFSDIVFRAHPRDNVSGEYLCELLSGPSFSGKLKSLAHGSAKSMSNISKTALERLPVPLPPLALQQQFADFVAEVDKLRFDSHSNNKISD